MDPSTTSYQYSQIRAKSSSDSIPNDFEPLSQMIGSDIQKLSQNVSQMQKMVNQIGTMQDSDSLRAQLHQVHEYTNKLAKDTNNNLKKLAQIPHTTFNQREHKLIKDRLYNEFMTALKNFQAVQRQAAAKEKESVMRARANSGLIGDFPSSQNPFENGTSSGASSDHNLLDLSSPSESKTQTQVTLQMEEEVNLDLLREREQAVRKIESDIRDVNQIFKDLASLVHEQGDVIDSIEANVETAVVQVSQGTQQIIKARQLQSKARRKKICLIIICVAVLVAVILIVAILSRN